MFARFDNQKSRVVECDSSGAKVRKGKVLTFSTTAAYVVLQDFGVRQADMLNRSELAEARRRMDGSVRAVPADYFMGC
jgi:hypothetical protein